MAYRDLLPVRAASYVVGFFNTNLGRGAMAAYLSRRLQAPFLELGSTVIFLVLTEYTQLVLWAMLGLSASGRDVDRSLLAGRGGRRDVLADLLSLHQTSRHADPPTLRRAHRRLEPS